MWIHVYSCQSRTGGDNVAPPPLLGLDGLIACSHYQSSAASDAMTASLKTTLPACTTQVSTVSTRSLSLFPIEEFDVDIAPLTANSHQDKLWRRFQPVLIWKVKNLFSMVRTFECGAMWRQMWRQVGNVADRGARENFYWICNVTYKRIGDNW
jgi:hypothetical protein